MDLAHVYSCVSVCSNPSNEDVKWCNTIAYAFRTVSDRQLLTFIISQVPEHCTFALILATCLVYAYLDHGFVLSNKDVEFIGTVEAMFDIYSCRPVSIFADYIDVEEGCHAVGVISPPASKYLLNVLPACRIVAAWFHPRKFEKMRSRQNDPPPVPVIQAKSVPVMTAVKYPDYYFLDDSLFREGNEISTNPSKCVHVSCGNAGTCLYGRVKKMSIDELMSTMPRQPPQVPPPMPVVERHGNILRPPTLYQLSTYEDGLSVDGGLRMFKAGECNHITNYSVASPDGRICGLCHYGEWFFGYARTANAIVGRSFLPKHLWGTINLPGSNSITIARVSKAIHAKGRAQKWSFVGDRPTMFDGERSKILVGQDAAAWAMLQKARDLVGKLSTEKCRQFNSQYHAHRHGIYMQVIEMLDNDIGSIQCAQFIINLFPRDHVCMMTFEDAKKFYDDFKRRDH